MKINWKGVLLWSNHFYGICAVLLSIESALLLNQVIPSPYLLLLIYLSTIVYYTHAYLQESKTTAINERVSWYQKHFTYLRGRQLLFICICIYLAFVKLNIVSLFLNATLFVKGILLATFILSAVYYMPNFHIPIFHGYRNYRTKGIFKSLTIAWVWTVTCCFIPAWLLGQFANTTMTTSFAMHFVQLYLYVLALAILFDIKDVNTDQKEQVYTIALTLGAEKTVKLIVAPILILYYLFVIYGVIYLGNSPVLFLLQGLLLALTYLIAIKILQLKAIYLNILLIDGLLVIKALLGIAYILVEKAT